MTNTYMGPKFLEIYKSERVIGSIQEEMAQLLLFSFLVVAGAAVRAYAVWGLRFVSDVEVDQSGKWSVSLVSINPQ